ncbi:hypothetical protein B0H14DRAFT_2802238 [Mycena olivaceomarginata]|nr:hypothetical protein B0H14DRAFT_2802238 [Mycena olivaceomarginata]
MVTQLPLGYPDIMLNYLPLRPIWVNDHSMILAIASCCRTSTFHWADNRPLVLPPHEAFGFVIDHYAVFDQAVGIEEISHDSHLLPEWFRAAEMLRHVATSNSYNTLAERNKIRAWLNQRHSSNDLQRTVDEKAKNPEQEGRSLDNCEQWLELEFPSICSPFTTHHTAHPPPPRTQGPISHHPSSHSLRTLPEAVAQPSSHPSQLPAPVRNDSAEGDPTDAATGTSHLL